MRSFRGVCPLVCEAAHGCVLGAMGRVVGGGGGVQGAFGHALPRAPSTFSGPPVRRTSVLRTSVLRTSTSVGVVALVCEAAHGCVLGAMGRVVGGGGGVQGAFGHALRRAPSTFSGPPVRRTSVLRTSTSVGVVPGRRKWGFDQTSQRAPATLQPSTDHPSNFNLGPGRSLGRWSLTTLLVVNVDNGPQAHRGK
jgi:hypothetical protein